MSLILCPLVLIMGFGADGPKRVRGATPLGEAESLHKPDRDVKNPSL